MVYDQAIVTEEMIEERWTLATEPATLASARRMYGKAALEAAMKAAAASDTPPLWAMLPKLKAKTLITWGRDDRVSPVDMAMLPMRAIPDVEVHIFPNCGHWVMIEQKDAWETRRVGLPHPRRDVEPAMRDRLSLSGIVGASDESVTRP